MRARLRGFLSRVDIGLLAAVALGAWLRFSRLGDFDNQYYTATVVSMLKSPANFLFASFDPGGAVMVDKPPVSFWVQAIPVSIFGPSRWAVSLPQAVAGTLAVPILYLAMKPAFGRVAALVAAIALAAIPASVVIDSRNEPDSLLSFTLLLSGFCVILSARTRKWLWLALFAVLMGAAFNIKMLVAFVPLPAFLLYYALANKEALRRTVTRLAAAVAILLAVSFSWTVLVALTPEGERPYVGSTRDNSIWTLVFKYNGLDRFTSFIGPRPGPGGAAGPLGAQPGGPSPQQPLPPGGALPGVGQAQPPPQGADGASAGLLGLFTQRLASQTGWLLPAALLMLMAALVPLLPERVYKRPAALLGLLREAPAASQTVLWGGWFVTAVMIFGLANSTTTHPYYLVGLAVPMAAVMGIGFAALWRTFGKGDGLAWLLPGAMAGAVLYQVVSSRGLVADWPPAMALVIVATGALGMGVAIWRGVTASPLSGLFVTLGALAVLAIPVGTALQAGGPIAGPAAGTTRGLPPPRGSPEGERTRQVASYIGQQGHGGSAFTVAALSAREAAPFIIAGVPALAIGGFSGNDPVFTLESFLAMTGRGEVRYFLMQGSQAQGQPQGQRSQEAILSHVRRSWQDVSAAAGLQPSTLYRFPGPGP